MVASVSSDVGDHGRVYGEPSGPSADAFDEVVLQIVPRAKFPRLTAHAVVRAVLLAAKPPD